MKSDLNRIKFLFEYTFKDNVKSESKPMPEYPTYEEYKDEVMIDEDGEPEDEVPAEPKAEPTTPPPANVQQADSAPAEPAPAPAPPVEPQAMPAPEQSPEDDEILTKIESTLSSQDMKIQQLMTTINNLSQAINPQAVPQSPEEKIMAKLDSLSKEVEGIKNPKPEDTFKNTAKNSSPFSINLADYYGEADEEEPKKPEFVIQPQDVENYDVTNIKKSLGLNESA